jgi:hypothetical protein
MYSIINIPFISTPLIKYHFLSLYYNLFFIIINYFNFNYQLNFLHLLHIIIEKINYFNLIKTINNYSSIYYSEKLINLNMNLILIIKMMKYLIYYSNNSVYHFYKNNHIINILINIKFIHSS